MDSVELRDHDRVSIQDQILPSLLRVHERLTVIESRMATREDLASDVAILQARIDARPSKSFVVGTVLCIIGLVILAMVATPYLAP